MQIDKKSLRKIFWVLSGCIVLYWLLHETERAKLLWETFSGVISPFVIGAGIAFILNVPMRAIERNLEFIKKDGLRRTAAIVLTLFSVVIVIYGVVQLLIPQIVDTITILIPKVTDFFLEAEAFVIAVLEDNPQILTWLGSNTEFQGIDWAGLIQQVGNILKNSLTAIASGAASAFGSIANAVVNAVIGFVFALYSLSRKEILARQCRRILYSILPERFTDEIIRIMRLTNSTFSNFISGQCVEACILGGMFAVAMAILKMPYIALISVLIAVTALVPIVGAFVGCFLGAFFILVNDPFQAVIFVVMFLVLQQIEGNLIYPKVVGTSIGLPGMWVLVAVTVGGELFGIAGMLLMIPLASVFYTLLREFTDRRVLELDIDPEKLKAQPPEVKNQFKENRERREQVRFRRRMQELAAKHKAQLKAKNQQKQ